jgi:hypothetical protein
MKAGERNHQPKAVRIPRMITNPRYFQGELLSRRIRASLNLFYGVFIDV